MRAVLIKLAEDLGGRLERLGGNVTSLVWRLGFASRQPLAGSQRFRGAVPVGGAGGHHRPAG